MQYRLVFLRAIWTLALFWFGTVDEAYSEENRRGLSSGTSFNYRVYADFDWIDQIGAEESVQEEAVAGKYASRTLGLTKIDVGLEWSLFDSSSFSLNLRPDSRKLDGIDGNNLEFDSRAGESYRNLPSVYLLDRYQLKFENRNQFSIGVGVVDGFTGISDRRSAYKLNLDYGLKVLFPRKFFAASFHWNGGAQKSALSKNSLFERLSYQVHIFQGREDRSELQGQIGTSGDRAPVSKKPFVGGSVSVEWKVAADLFTYFLFGRDTDKIDGSQIDEDFVMGFAAKNYLIFGKKSTLTFDGRLSRETWTEKPELRLFQSSTSIKNSLETWSRVFLLTGIHLGKSERFVDDGSNNLLVHDGYQIDLGAEKEIGKNLNFSLMVASEKRVVTDENGSEIGAFDFGNTDQILRFSFNISYLTGSNR